MKQTLLFGMLLLLGWSLAVSAPSAPVLFTIGVHVEPFGTTAQGFGNDDGLSYHNDGLFNRHYADLERLAQLVEKYGGKLTVQVQSPFTEVLIEKNRPLLPDLERRGHEIALHFHEDAHLGKRSQDLSPERWTEVMREEIELIYLAGATNPIVYWSGGNLYPHILDAGAAAGLTVRAEWKNRFTQSVEKELTGLWPWRPAGGMQGDSVQLLATHDPDGPIIYLPQGIIDIEAYGNKNQIVQQQGLSGWLDVIASDLRNSVSQARADRVNVFHFTVHPGEFVGDPANPYQELEAFLRDVVTPLVEQGKVKWATYAQKATAYERWEQLGIATEKPPVIEPTRASTPQGDPNKMGNITFVINVHDIANVDRSADTLIRFCRLFEKYGVKGDFYLTGRILQFYQEQRPDVVEVLKQTDMTISYHFRPPHVAYVGFDQPLEKMAPAQREKLLRDFETYRLDLRTGRLDRSAEGGFSLVKSVFEQAPVVASALNPKWKQVQLPIFREMGAQMTLTYHEEGADPENPFQWQNGLLVRPSDLGVTSWTDPAFPGDSEQFWWNHATDRYADLFDPVAHLQNQLEQWPYSRDPFVTSLIHENNLYARGRTWESMFYEASGNPQKPPFSLENDSTTFRSEQEQQAIWTKYEQMVAWAAQHMNVVTSKEIVQMAGEPK